MKSIRVPVMDKSKVSKSEFLSDLRDALQPLLQYNPWLHIQISDDDGGSRDLDGSRGVESPGDVDDAGWFVCWIHWDQQSEGDDWDNSKILYSRDFMGDNPPAVRVFRRVFKDLRRHLEVPDIPHKLKKALVALK